VRRNIATMPTVEGMAALADAIESGRLDSIPVERAIRTVRGIAARRARTIMRACDIVGNPRLREVSPARREALVSVLREAA
jgi:ribosomal protein S13